MVRRLLALTFLLLLSMLVLLPVVTQAVTGLKVFATDICMPEITVFCNIDEDYPLSDITAALNADTLDTVSIVSARDMPTVYYLLVDTSVSITKDFFEAEKRMIKTFAEKLSDDDMLVLITFGEKVSVILNGSEDRSEIAAAVDGINDRGTKTLFYNAVKELLSHSETVSIEGYRRKAAFIISDAVDTKGTNITYEEIVREISDAGIVMYGLCVDYKDESDPASMGSLVRASNGELYMFTDVNATDIVSQAFDDAINCHAITFRTKSNIVTGEMQTLSLLIKTEAGAVNTAIDIKPIRWLPDNVVPEILSAEYLSENGVIRVTFSEPVKGADSPEAYDVIAPNGQRIPVHAARYANDKKTQADLQFEQIPADGLYTVNPENIYDISMENNLIKSISADTDIHNGILSAEIIAALVITAVAIICVITVIFIIKSVRKKTTVVTQIVNPPPETVYVPIESDSGQYVSGYGGCLMEADAYEGDRFLKSLKVNVKEGTCLGRSEICEIVFNDTKMSRQHAMLEFDNGRLYVTDLESGNGTFVNGIRIFTHYALSEEDTITLGMTDIKIKVIKT